MGIARQSIEDLKCELYPKNASQVWDSYRNTTQTYDWYDDDLVCDAIERTHEIAYERIEDIHPNTDMKLPSYTIPKGKSANEALICLLYTSPSPRDVEEYRMPSSA